MSNKTDLNCPSCKALNNPLRGNCWRCGSELAAPQGSADFWCVRFETKEGQSHPIWYGEKGGKQWTKEQIRQLAESYLKENSHWLKSIDDIYPPNAPHELPPTKTP